MQPSADMPSSYSLPDLVEKEIDALVRAGYYSSKSDVVKDALRTFLDKKPSLRLAAAIELYRREQVSLGKAAEIAEMPLVEFKEVLASQGHKRVLTMTKQEASRADELTSKMR
ncbi:MAG: UPF0175 family protein [Nitrososphaerota archaeon]|nr:UPF0175 family protein [Nitrososphaerota archaeon]MDG6981368.1 UPF0175 family protein [Nitrososphaerota archaeon]